MQARVGAAAQKTQIRVTFGFMSPLDGSLADTNKNTNGIHVRLAATSQEIEAAQRLRYKVFYEEWGAIPTPEMVAEKREIETFDQIMDHIIVVDPSRGAGSESIVGTYRLLRDEIARQHGKFYTSQEFDISTFMSSGARLLEMGRSCVLPEYRTMPVLQLLWQGIADYVAEHKIELMFGCASFRGIDVQAVAEPLSYLYHFHLSPENLRPRALDDVYVNMNILPKKDINPRRAIHALEPLIKGYLRAGATIGDGAYIDRQFNSIDVCIVLPTHLVTSKYMRHYQRTTQKELVTHSAFTESMPAMARGTTGA